MAVSIWIFTSTTLSRHNEGRRLPSLFFVLIPMDLFYNEIG